MKVVIIGCGDMLSNLIRGALLSGAEIVGVLRYERLRFSPFRLFFHDFLKSSTELTLMKKNKIKDLSFKSANSEEFRQFLIKQNVDILLVGTWKEKLKKNIIDVPVVGTVNVHPSLLPKYRGPNPYLQTILHGENKSGVTFHLMDEDFDTGAILAQKEVEILEGDTGKELKNKTVFQARLLCADLLEKLASGLVIPLAQNEADATYFHNVKPIDMTLDFYNETADEILRRIRAFHPWLPVYLQYKTVFFKVNSYKAEKSELQGNPGEFLAKDKDSLTVAAKDGCGIKMNGLRLYGCPLLTRLVIALMKLG